MDFSFGAKANLWRVGNTVIDLSQIVIIDAATDGGDVLVTFSGGEQMTIPGKSGEALWQRAASLCLNQSQFNKKAENAQP